MIDPIRRIAPQDLSAHQVGEIVRSAFHAACQAAHSDRDRAREFALQGETTFTGAVLVPAVNEALQKTRIHGLAVDGDGCIRSARPCTMFGQTFIPDLAVRFRSRQLLALEVKVLRTADRSGAIAKGIGQATVYSMRGYEHSGLLIADLGAGFEEARVALESVPWLAHLSV